MYVAVGPAERAEAAARLRRLAERRGDELLARLQVTLAWFEARGIGPRPGRPPALVEDAAPRPPLGPAISR